MARTEQAGVKRLGRVKVSREGQRLEGGQGRSVEVEVKERKERSLGGSLGFARTSKRYNGKMGSVSSVAGERGKQVRKEVRQRREEVEKREQGRRKEKEAAEWEEERVRVGTGYRVRKGESEAGESGVLPAGTERRFEVGYGDTKKYTRPEGVEVELGKTNTGRKVKSKGRGARERVMKVVCIREGRRKRSVYTGCGRIRKSRVGKKKLKPTKVRAR